MPVADQARAYTFARQTVWRATNVEARNLARSYLSLRETLTTLTEEIAVERAERRAALRQLLFHLDGALTVLEETCPTT